VSEVSRLHATVPGTAANTIPIRMNMMGNCIINIIFILIILSAFSQSKMGHISRDITPCGTWCKGDIVKNNKLFKCWLCQKE
jgi:hypothetical protein